MKQGVSRPVAFDNPSFERLTWAVRDALFLMHRWEQPPDVLFSRTVFPPPLPLLSCVDLVPSGFMDCTVGYERLINWQIWFKSFSIASLKNTLMNLWRLLTLVIPQGKSSTKEKRPASSMCLVLQKSHYYLKCKVTSTRFKPWAFTGQMLDQSICPHLLFWCMWAISWLLSVDSGFVLKPGINLQHNSLQKKWP